MLNLSDNSKVVVEEGKTNIGGPNKYLSGGIRKVRITDFEVRTSRAGDKVVVFAHCEGPISTEIGENGATYEGLRGELTATGEYKKVALTIYFDPNIPEKLQSLTNDIIHIGTVTGTIGELSKIQITPSGDAIADLKKNLKEIAKVIKDSYFWTSLKVEQTTNDDGTKVYENLSFNRGWLKEERVFTVLSAHSVESFVSLEEVDNDKYEMQILTYKDINGKELKTTWTKNKDKSKSWNYTWAEIPDSDDQSDSDPFSDLGDAPSVDDLDI
jgi:hypothetical protein